MAQRKAGGGNSRSRSVSARPGTRASTSGKSAKKAPAKKTVTKKVAAKKTAKKSTAKAPAKKAPAKKTAPKKSVAKKAPAKKPASKKAVTKKAPAKKPVAKKAPAKKAVVKKAPAKKAPAKKAAPKKPVAKKATPTKTVGPKAPVKKAVSSKPASSKPVAEAAPAKAPPPKPVKSAATKTAAKPSARGRKPLTPAERREMKGVLIAERVRLQAEIATAVEDLNELLRDSGEGSGDDQADAGSKTFEREHEMSVANNSRDLLEQVEHALVRIADGTYGICESCGLPIGKMRVEAFPRATLCLDCKQREERR